MNTVSPLFDVAGKRVLVTGASRGIGRAIATGFAAAGAYVLLVARSESDLIALKDSIRADGGQAHYLRVDLSEPNAPDQTAASAVESLGGIDVLVNNAGIDLVGCAVDLPRSDFESVMRFNVDTNFALTRAAGRVMIEAGSGKVINITSVFSAVAIRDDSAYIASKHALLGLTRALALEWARDNVQVNALAPGFVPTEMTRAEVENEAAMRSVVRRIPIGRPAQPDDLLGAAIFLASRASDYMTGQTLFVDGGWTVQ